MYTKTTLAYMGIKLGGDPETVYREQFPQIFDYMVKIGESASDYVEDYKASVDLMAQEDGAFSDFSMGIYDAENKHIGDAVFKFLNARPYAIMTSLPLEANHPFFDAYWAFLTAQKDAQQEVVNNHISVHSHHFDDIEEGVEYYYALADEYEKASQELQKQAEAVDEELAELYG